MKLRSQYAALLVASILIWGAALGCTKSETEPAEREEPALEVNAPRLERKLDAAKAAFEDRRKELLALAEQRMAQLDEKIDELKQDVAEGGEEAKREALQELQGRRDQLKETMERARNTSAERWEELRDAARETLDDAEETYNRVLEKLKTK